MERRRGKDWHLDDVEERELQFGRLERENWRNRFSWLRRRSDRWRHEA